MIAAEPGVKPSAAPLDSEPPRAATSAPAPDPPDPWSEVDALEDLGEEIVSLTAHIQVAKHRLLVLLADFDRREGWRLEEHRSCAHWLHHMTGMGLHAAREHVRVARALAGLPLIGAAMARGELHFSQARELTRVATVECEEELLEVARSVTTAELERFVADWRWIAGGDEEALERERWRGRRLVVVPDAQGMYRVRGSLPPEVGAVVRRALEAAADALFSPEALEETTAKQRWADALGLVAERALAAGFGGSPTPSATPAAGEAESGADVPRGTSADGRPRDAAGINERVSRGTRGRADAPAGAPVPAPLSGSRAERYQVFVHVDPETLAGPGPPARIRGGEPGNGGVGRLGSAPESAGGSAPGAATPGRFHPRSHLEDGTRLSAETARRLTCDAALVRVLWSGEGELLEIGRRSRTIPPAIRRVVEVRDRGCRWPACGVPFCDVHHLVHWAHGGETNLENLILLCHRHHRAVHVGGWRVERWGRDRHLVFIDPGGRVRMVEQAGEGIRARPTPELSPDPVGAVVARGRARGVEAGLWTNAPRYRRARDVPRAVTARALEALEAAYAGNDEG